MTICENNNLRWICYLQNSFLYVTIFCGMFILSCLGGLKTDGNKIKRAVLFWGLFLG